MKIRGICLFQANLTTACQNHFAQNSTMSHPKFDYLISVIDFFVCFMKDRWCFQEKAIQKNSWKLCHSFSIGN